VGSGSVQLPRAVGNARGNREGAAAQRPPPGQQQQSFLRGALRPVEPMPAPSRVDDQREAHSGDVMWVRKELERGAGMRMQQVCGLCGPKGGQVPLDELLVPMCGHLFCGACLRNHVIAQDFVREAVECPAQGCETKLDPTQVRHLVGKEFYEQRHKEVNEQAVRALQEEFAREQADEEARLAQHMQFECPLCFDKGRRDEAIELDCDHRLCQECFRNYLDSKIMEAQVAEDELVCPIPACKTEITVAQIEGATGGTALWEKFLQFRMNIWRPRSGEGTFVECPKSECGKFLVPVNIQFVQCPVCRLEFCVKCGQKKHEGVACEAFRAWQQENGQADKHFEALMAQQQWRRCPVCSAPSERESGCNFMQCRSERCRKRTYWCYVCGKHLNKEDHYSHYPRGPYEDECHTPAAEHLPIAGQAPTPAAGSAYRGVVDAAGGMLGAVQGWFGAQQPVAPA